MTHSIDIVSLFVFILIINMSYTNFVLIGLIRLIYHLPLKYMCSSCARHALLLKL